MICLQTNGYIGPKTEVHYRGRDEELIFSPQYLFRHEESAPIPATVLPPFAGDDSTFQTDLALSLPSDQESFPTTDNDGLLSEYEPINLNFDQDEVSLPMIEMTDMVLEPKDITTDPEVVSDGIGETSELPRLLTIVNRGEHPRLFDQTGKPIDVDYLLEKPESEEATNFYDPFNQKEAVNPLFSFMHGFTSQEDLSGSNTNHQHRWLPLFKPIFPRKKQRLMKRMSVGDAGLLESESEKQEVQINSPHIDSQKMRKVKEVFNRVDSYITSRIQNCIHKLNRIMNSERQLLENLYKEEKSNKKKL